MNINKKYIFCLIICSFLASHLLLPDIFEIWNLKVIDQLFVYRSNSKYKPDYDDTVVHVDINNTSLEQLDDFYLNRKHYAKCISNLAEMEVYSQIYDFIFAAPSSEHEDQELINATLKAGNVYFGLAFNLLDNKQHHGNIKVKDSEAKYLNQTKWLVKIEGDASLLYTGFNPLITFTDLANVSKGTGYINIKHDKDGFFRRIPLLIKYDSGFYPGYALLIVCDYLSVNPQNIIVKPGKKIILKNAKKPGQTDPYDISIPIDMHGNMVINFIGSWENMTHYNFSDVLHASANEEEMEMWQDELYGKIVVISDVSTGTPDIGPVPGDTNFPLSGLHANAINTILTQSFIKELTDFEMILIELFLMIIILFLSSQLSSITFSLSTMGVGLLYLITVSYLFFYCNIILQIVRPFIMIIFSFTFIIACRYINEEKEKLVLRKSFEAYFPPSVVKKIIANPSMVTSGRQEKELTILFSDIKSFTSYSSNMKPDEIQKLLNEYFEAMTEIVFNYNGTVDKFIGDGLMVFFGDTEPNPEDHALRCVRAAIDMQKKVREIKIKWTKQGLMPIQIRIGINTGNVVVGNMGSLKRLSYTVIGSEVNLAQRLEANAPVEGILISERTCELVKDQIKTGSVKQIKVKGYDTYINVYEVIF